MKQSTANQAPRALNRGGVEAGAPLISDSEKISSLAAHQAFIEDLQPRANYPYRGSIECQRALADYLAECQAAQKASRQPSKFTLSSFELDPRLAAMIVALLIAICTILWAGCRVVSYLPVAIGERVQSTKIDAVK